MRGEDWSAVCKVLSGARVGHPRWPTSEDPTHFYWWRREEVAYRTGLLAELGGGLRAPRFLASFERPDGTVALWMEDVTAPSASSWSVERYRRCAWQLARAQAAFANDLPTQPWLAAGFLAGYLDRHVDAFDGAPRTPLVERARRIFAERRRLLSVLDALPTTLCHNDFHGENLFGHPEGESIAVDWSFVGVGALGEDAGALAPDAALDYMAPADRIVELYDAVEDGYLDGLRDARFACDLDAVRAGLRVVGGLKFTWIAAVAADPDDAQRARWAWRYGREADEVVADWTRIAEAVVDRGAAALDALG